LTYHNDIAVLHCVSEYPCEFDRLGFSNIQTLISEFPDCAIGSSDHFNGTLSGPVAYMQGARIFEKHVTLNRAWRGTDHSFALEPGGFRNFVRDLKRVPKMLPLKPQDDLGNEYVFQKLGKSMIALTDIEKGDKLSLQNLSGKIFNSHHIPVRESAELIGKTAKVNIPMGSPIKRDDLEN
jgi:N-acetylneuraminate synthase/sialic acid synthase